MTLEERVAFLEGRVDEQVRTGDGIRDAVSQVEVRLAQLEGRMDRRFEAVDRRFEAVEVRLAQLEERMDRRFEAVDHRFEAVDAKLTRYFVWLAGIQVSTFIALVTAVFATISRMP